MTQPCPPPDLEYAFRVAAGDTPPTDDRPFNERGHHRPGRIDTRVLLQTRIWIDANGQVHDLTAMDRTYRDNVLHLLRREATVWTERAHHFALRFAIAGIITPAQATREIEAVASLPEGWVDHTPLGVALHRLNGTTPPPLQYLRPPLTPTDTDTPEVLHDHDDGLWQVTTRSGAIYTLDLDHRGVRRLPAPVNGDTPVNRLPGDGRWTRLLAVVDCSVGRDMLALDRIGATDSYRHSTPISRIDRIASHPNGAGAQS